MDAVSRYPCHAVGNLVRQCSEDNLDTFLSQETNPTHLKHTAFATTLAPKHAYLGKVYLRCCRANGGEDILELVDDGDDL